MKRLAAKRAADRLRRMIRRSEIDWQGSHLRWIIEVKSEQLCAMFLPPDDKGPER